MHDRRRLPVVGNADIAVADSTEIATSLSPVAGLLELRRGFPRHNPAKIRLPIRTIVAPSSMAGTKSPLIPIDN